MRDLTDLADQAAIELLNAIRDQARKATDLKLLQLAQAYSLVVSTEVSTRLADAESTRMGEYEAAADIDYGKSASPE